MRIKQTRLFLALLLCLNLRLCTTADGIRGVAGWISSLISRISSKRSEGKEPQVGDAVVRRTVLDEKANLWKHVPRRIWPRQSESLHVVDTVPEAVEDCLDNGYRKVFVGSGRHSWEGDRLIVGGWRANEQFQAEGTYPKPGAEHSLNITGEPQARMWGMWVLEPCASGSFEGIMLAYKTDRSNRPTIEVWDGPWFFGSCDLRSTGGTALAACRRTKVLCKNSGIGGLEAGERDEFGDWTGSVDYAGGSELRASYGIRMKDIATVTLVESTVEFTGLAGAGVVTTGQSVFQADDSEFIANSVAVYIDDNSTVQVTCV